MLLTGSLTDCHIWFNFFHRALFFKSFFAQEFGAHVVFAIMAHMTFLREGTTTTGQLRALHFAEEARKMVDYCLAANDRDPTLAQTALLLVAFEFQPHMQQNLARATAAFGFMETCARTCLPYWAQAATDRGPTSANSPAAIRREEMRQMCWALSHLAANSAIWRHLVGQPPLCLSSADPVKVWTATLKAEADLRASSWRSSLHSFLMPIERYPNFMLGRSTVLQCVYGK